MRVEFVDTNVLVYSADKGAGAKFTAAVDLIERLVDEEAGALSTQVLIEFCSAATRKLRMPDADAEAIIRGYATWTIHRPAHSDILNAIHLQRRHKISWWDALIVNSAIESEARILWTEAMNDGKKIGHLTVRNPFQRKTGSRPA
jgi:predicted nucleic acid-binding protein